MVGLSRRRDGEALGPPDRAQRRSGVSRDVPSPGPSRGSLGGLPLTRQPRPGAQARRAQRRRTRSRRHDGGSPPAPHQGRLAGDPPSTRRWHVPSCSRPPGDDPQARGRGARAGRADGPRSLPPAGVEPGPHTDLRAFVLGPQLRLPARSERPPGRGSGEAGDRGGRDLGRRCRSRPVLRGTITLHPPSCRPRRRAPDWPSGARF